MDDPQVRWYLFYPDLPSLLGRTYAKKTHKEFNSSNNKLTWMLLPHLTVTELPMATGLLVPLMLYLLTKKRDMDTFKHVMLAEIKNRDFDKNTYRSRFAESSQSEGKDETNGTKAAVLFH